MPAQSITTDTGTIVSVAEKGGETLVLLDHPEAPDDMRNTEAGRIIDGGFQPYPFASWAATPSTLRALADLIEAVGDSE
ncbi:hypothetical protein [Nocardia cerradoensis]|uniref:Uncharacterized protein n=1 Tax=Nocardia cerradoensis TaxID=85688 RepID=A0A231GSR7_9NOCA|nr:hypothetical protein [Nocardia cerradoensis]NKY47982.1 hypothetical protein [Nocardia cerradoensis]OXR39663.1 hypothetical protein B7C42_08268 [Nocardia cerradoensis]